jgi:hypothetical protein
VAELYLDVRLDALRRIQNPDGGWGYFPGKQSWLEPTAYAALALHGEPQSDRAWKLLKSWQTADGSWRPGTDVQISNWGTSLCVTIATVRGEFDESFRKGIDWLLTSEGTESNMLGRVAAKIGLMKPERNLSLTGWPWKPNTSSWVEPTAHALVALKRAAAKVSTDRLTSRVKIGEAQLLDVRCADGGWNYGSRAALGVDLPSYPETTALGLLGLQGHGDVAKSIEIAGRMLRENPSPLAKAWLTIALRLHGVDVPALSNEWTPDNMITSVEALSCANYKFFKTGGEA